MKFVNRWEKHLQRGEGISNKITLERKACVNLFEPKLCLRILNMLNWRTVFTAVVLSSV